MNIELLFETQFNKFMEERKHQTLEAMTNTVLPYEEYAEKVGYLRALRDVEVNFKRLIKSYFEENNTYG